MFITSLYADSGSTVSLQVPGTALFIKGEAPPGSFLTINDNGSLITTVSVNRNGLFIVELNSIPSGINYLHLSYADVHGTYSALATISVSIQPLQQVTLSVFMPPTIDISNNSILNGYAYPNSIVTVFLSNDQQYQTISNSLGYWSMKISSLPLLIGNYTAHALDSDSSGESYFSSDVNFSVNYNSNLGSQPSVQSNGHLSIIPVKPSITLINKNSNQTIPGNKSLPDQISKKNTGVSIVIQPKPNFVRKSIIPITVIKYMTLITGLSIVAYALTQYIGLEASFYHNIWNHVLNNIKRVRH
jgi:hypothetical protein